METKLQHVSDTALMVAAARALETKRADRLCCDPFAEVLAGERGHAILENVPNASWMAFGMGLRTKFIDEIILDEVHSNGVNCVVSLGSGLDARPWRLDVPSDLRWIEVDFAGILDYKYGVLQEETPRCHLERVTADVTDRQRRQEIWNSIRGLKVLLLTEGFLMYLPAETVRALAAEASQLDEIESWIVDFHSPALLKAAHGDGASAINNLRAATHLNSEEVRAVVNQNGWVIVSEKRFVRDGGPYAWQRMQADGIKPDPKVQPVSPDDPAGVALLRRA